jgi:hypothetical protein
MDAWTRPPDERGGVLERPDELIDHLHHVDGDVGGLPSFGHEEDRDLVVARTQELQEGMRTLVIVIVSQRPVEQHRVDRGVRCHHRSSIFRRRRLDDIDAAALQLFHERPYSHALRRSDCRVRRRTTSARKLIRVVPRWIMSLAPLFRIVIHWKNVSVLSSYSPNHLVYNFGKSGDA